MSVYLDELFVMNFIACLFMLLLYRRLMSLPKSTVRLIAASALGAAAACARFLTGSLFFMAADIAAVLIAFKKISPERAVLFILIKYAFSGLSVLAVSFFGGSAAIIRSGVIYFDISPAVFAAAFAMTYISGAGLVRLIKRRRKRFYTLVLYKGEESVRLSALYDSGNLLKDPYDGTEVVIAQLDAVRDIWDGRFVLIPFKSLGTENGLIKAFKADRAVLVETGKRVNNLTIGVSEAALSKNGKIQALIGDSFKEE